jgi:hypothetical protein
MVTDAMTSTPLVFIHLSDIHIPTADARSYFDVDAAQNVRRLLGAVRALEARPSFFVISGDLTAYGQPEEYRHLRSLLSEFDEFGVPVLLCIGNEDQRPHFRRVMLDEPESADSQQPYYYSQVVDGLKVIVLDSTIPGEVGGDLDERQLAWLDDELSDPGPRGALAVMHHPVLPRTAPVLPEQAFTGWFRGADRLAPVVRNRPGMLGILTGHYHTMSLGVFEGVLAATCADTVCMADPSIFDGGRSLQGSGFNLCAVRDGRLMVSPVILPGDQRELGRHRFTERADFQQIRERRLAQERAVSLSALP